MFRPLREAPQPSASFSHGLVAIFGETFQRGYVNGLIEEAEKSKASVVYSTMGRRDESKNLRPLNPEELAQKPPHLINVPLEAGFDLWKAKEGQTVVDRLKNVSLKDWESFSFPKNFLEDIKHQASQDFKLRLKAYLSELKPYLSGKKKILFVHTMAGGIPRAKILMALVGRTAKGHGERYFSSKNFWEKTDLGRLCQESFQEVTAETFQHLIEETSSLRQNYDVSYVAYGYHGTEIFIDDHYEWQSYSPYLQGFAKLRLEEISQKAKGVKTCVFNVPEILTKSSKMFSGVEVPLYNLMGALRKEKLHEAFVKDLLEKCEDLLKPEYKLDDILSLSKDYFHSPVMKEWNRFEDWPRHNGKEQMTLMFQQSKKIIDMHKDPKNLMTDLLSELIFKACGKIIYRLADSPPYPVCWIGHDLISKSFSS